MLSAWFTMPTTTALFCTMADWKLRASMARTEKLILIGAWAVAVLLSLLLVAALLLAALLLVVSSLGLSMVWLRRG